MNVKEGGRKEKSRPNCEKEHLFSTYYVPGTCYVLSLQISIDFHKTMVLLLAHFIDKKTEAQRCEVPCPR